MPTKGLQDSLKTKSFRYGNIYFSDLFNSMFLVSIEIPNSTDDLSRSFFYSDTSKKSQRAAARQFYNKAKDFLAKGDYDSLEELLS